MLLTALIVIVALIVWGVKAVISYRDALKHQQLEQARIQAQKEQVIEPVPCDLRNIKVSVSPSQASIAPEGKLDFDVEIHNPSTTRPCYMQASSKIFGVQVVTGETVVYNSTDCHKNDPDLKILLDADDRYKRTFPWAAVAYDSSCKAGDPLQPGTYRVHPYISGHHYDNEAVFQVN